MSIGIRGKLFLLAAIAITLIVVVGGSYVQSHIDDAFHTSTRDELYRHAKATGVVLERNPTTTIDATADRMADATGVVIEVFDLHGNARGDSTRAPLELEQLTEPNADPEVRTAIADGSGNSVREIDGNDVPTMFVAVKVAAPGSAVIARASAPMGQTATAVARLRIAMAVAWVLGLAVSAILLIAVATQVERTLQPVVSTAAAVFNTVEADRESQDPDAGPQSLRTVALDLERTMGLLATERNRFEAVLQTMEQAVLVLGPDQRLSTVNRAAGTLFSLPERAVGRTLLEAVRVPRLKELVEQASKGGTHRAEFDLPGGRRIDARATEHGDQGVVLVAQDVTEIRHLERVRRDFVANVSHELRTPISVVKANTETLLDGGLDDEKVARKFTEAIHRHADRLGRIVNDLLDISRIEAGRYPLHPMPLDMGETVDHVLDLVEGDAGRKDMDVSVTIEPDLFVMADRKAMEHILINLTTNAVKYTPDRGAVEVTAFVEREGKVRVEVRDDGPGIDPAHRERIFERFFRVDSGRSRDKGGTGLGLSIVKHLVEAHGGEVGVDARSPHGSTFWFVMDAPRADGSDDRRTDGASR